jgi:hypothetical protein
MMINTLEELRQRIGKYVMLSSYADFRKGSAVMKLITKVENKSRWLAERFPDSSPLYGCNVWGKFSACYHPFSPFVKDKNGESYSNSYSYARDPTEEEIKTFKQNWRKTIFRYKIHPKNEGLPI